MRQQTPSPSLASSLSPLTRSAGSMTTVLIAQVLLGFGAVLVASEEVPAGGVLSNQMIQQMPRMPATCAQLMSGQGDSDEKLLLCQLYESSSLLTQLGALVSQGLDRLMVSQGVLPIASESSAAQESGDGAREKKKHEYLRFGKRKHEYLRFGKRKHEYLRFG